MDTLELLKNDWNTEKQNEFKQYSEKELFEMTRKKSVSISKQLFIFGMIEIAIWLAYEFLFRINLRPASIVFSKISLSICFSCALFYFYERIKQSENSKTMMKNIITLRKVIFAYLLTIILIETILRGFAYISNIQKSELFGTQSIAYSLGYTLGILTFILLIFWIYKKTYGKLLKRLKANYEELKRNEQN